MDALKHAVEAIEQMDVYVGNGHLMHHGNKSKWTSASKAATWRIIASAITAGLVYFGAGHLNIDPATQKALATGVGLVDIGVKLLAYYGHERIWLKLGARLDRRIVNRSTQ
ncbi:MAG: DUF2061 domain-containing protein [Thermoplasmata archaeon]|nr:DUF2061 domain-containing protein [Thermoplasmata archaeon]